jgi:predicted NBD/HSP70 family sugar kinase
VEHQEFEERLKRLVGDSKVAQEVFGEILARAARQSPNETTRLHIGADDSSAQRSVDRRKIPQATVSRAVNALLKEGLLEGGSSQIVGNDNRRLLTLRFGRRFLIAGVDIELRGKGGPEYVTTALIGLDNMRVLAHSREKVPAKGSDRWDNAACLVSRELETLLGRLNEARAVIGEDSTEFEIFGIGVEIPAPVNDGEVTLVPSGNKKAIPFEWKLRKALSENASQKDLPILIQNDVNALAVLAAREAKYKHSDLVVVSVFKEGVGGGLVMDGRLRRGGNGMAMEIGHLPVSVPGDKVSPWGGTLRSEDERDPTEPEGFFDPCWCGASLHVDTFATPSRIGGQLQLQPALQVRDYRKAATSRGTYAPDEFTDTGEIFRKAGSALGRALAHTCNIVNPSSLVVYLPKELYRPSHDDVAAKKFDETAAGVYYKAASSEITSAFANKDLDPEKYLNFVPLPSEPEELAILLARAAAACVFESFIEHALKLDGCQPNA